MGCLQCDQIATLLFSVGPELHIKNYSSNVIHLYWTECTNIRITSKVDCPQECHLFISAHNIHTYPFCKTTHSTYLSHTKHILHIICLTFNQEVVLL